MIYIGIDVGTHTGVAVWDSKERALVSLQTMPIHRALDFVRNYKAEELMVVVEDARLRKWYGTNAEAKKQGAGSVKRDSAIWEDFLLDMNIPHWMMAPLKGYTKLNKEQFYNLTKYQGKSTEHSRDAAMLVYGR